MKYDMLVIGAGPGGYVAAIRGAQLGLKVAVVEKENVGGVCLNWGCIPTKALLYAAETFHNMKNAETLGIKCQGVEFDLGSMVEHSRRTISKLTNGVRHLLQKNKVDVIAGHAKIAGINKVIVNDQQELSAKNIVVVTGGRAKLLPGMKAGKRIWTYREALSPVYLPKRMIIIGSGAIGAEFASFYGMLGVSVTLVEAAAQILPAEDHEISALCRTEFEKRGITVKLSTKLVSMVESKDIVKVVLEADGKAEELKFDTAMSAISIVPNLENIGLENVKVELERGFIKTDQWLQTTQEGVYAIGDVTAPPWLAHKASHEAVLCAEHIAKKLGKKVGNLMPMKRENIPGCTYSSPQVASIGLTEAVAKEKGYAIKVGRFPLSGSGKAISMLADYGMVKVIFEQKTGELLGAHMVGPEVTELIQGFSIAKYGELTEEELVHTIFPHPTISEAMHEAVLDAIGLVLHK